MTGLLAVDRSPVLCLFTGSYPCELVLQYELRFLAQRFERIFIFPSGLRDMQAHDYLPENTVVVDALAHPANLAAARLWPYLALGAGVFMREIFGKRRRVPVSTVRDEFWILREEMRRAAVIEGVVAAEGLEEALYYDYWFENSLLALSFLKKRGRIRHLVCRAHRFDLYDDVWAPGSVPYRKFKMEQVDEVFVISKSGARYLKARVAKQLQKKISYSRLGIPAEEAGVLVGGRPSEPFRIISVSSTQPHKRAHLIPEVLCNVDVRVEWTHFGDGPMSEQLRANARKLPETVSWTFRGHVENGELRHHYRSHGADLFLSLSASEGIPVSMMEALSFGVPIVACNAGAVAEAVCPTTGVLVERDLPLRAISEVVRGALTEFPFERRRIREFFEERFSAERNYPVFARDLSRTLGRTSEPL